MGISVRTCNSDFSKLQQDIGGLWQQFFAENILQKTPTSLNNDIYLVYTNYDGDYLDPYDTIIGSLVPMDAPLPSGLIEKIIPEQKYQVFCAKGTMPMAVVQTWQNIWQTPLHRNYIADFDIYSEKSQHPDNAEVDIWVGIR